MIRSPLHNRHVAVILFIVLAVVLIAPPTPAQEAVKNRTLVVIGTGRVANGDISSARKAAISDALVTAVGLVSTELLHPLVIVESFEDMNRLLLTSAGSFVQYKILTESTSNRIYRVLVEADVAIDRIRMTLAQNDILVQKKTALRALLLIAERQLDETGYRCWWADPFTESIAETGLVEALGSQEFEVVDHGQFLSATLEAYLEETESPQDWDISDAQAAFFGSWYQADVVVVGTARAETASNSMGNELKSFRGTLSVRAIRADSGEILAESTREILTADVDDIAGGHKALAEAGIRTGTLLAGQIQSAWNQFKETGPIGMTVVVRGGYQLADFVQFRRVLSTLPAISSLQTTSKTPEETILEVEYDGSAQEMAETLLLKSFDGFGINIAEVTPEALKLSLVPN